MYPQSTRPLIILMESQVESTKHVTSFTSSVYSMCCIYILIPVG